MTTNDGRPFPKRAIRRVARQRRSEAFGWMVVALLFALLVVGTLWLVRSGNVIDVSCVTG